MFKKLLILVEIIKNKKLENSYTYDYDINNVGKKS